VRLENISKKGVENSLKKFKKLDFYTSTKSISRNGYVMKEKKELLTNFNFFFIPMMEMLQEKIQSLCNFSFLKIVKIEPANKVQTFFIEKHPFGTRKKSLFISFTSLIRME
jgi:uncharacterized protein YlbG (UPF0298 family)